MLAFAISVIGLSRNDFDWLLPSEFQECIRIYNDKQEAEIKGKFELERFNAWLNLTPHVKGRSQEEIIRFPWEVIKKGKVLNAGSNAISKIKSAT